MESNARLVRWADGTTHLILGGNEFLNATFEPIHGGVCFVIHTPPINNPFLSFCDSFSLIATTDREEAKERFVKQQKHESRFCFLLLLLVLKR